MEGFWSPLELLYFLVWLCDLWVGVGVGGGLARKWDGFSGGAVGSLIVGGWLGVGGDGSVLGVGVPVSGVGRGMRNGCRAGCGKGNHRAREFGA